MIEEMYSTPLPRKELVTVILFAGSSAHVMQIAKNKMVLIEFNKCKCMSAPPHAGSVPHT